MFVLVVEVEADLKTRVRISRPIAGGVADSVILDHAVAEIIELKGLVGVRIEDGVVSNG